MGANTFFDIGSFLFNIVFLFLYFDIYTLSLKMWPMLVFVSDNFCHQDKNSLPLTNKIFIDKVFNLVRTYLYCANFVLFWKIVVPLFVIWLHAFLSRCALVLITFFRTPVFPQLNSKVFSNCISSLSFT